MSPQPFPGRRARQSVAELIMESGTTAKTMQEKETELGGVRHLRKLAATTELAHKRAMDCLVQALEVRQPGSADARLTLNAPPIALEEWKTIVFTIVKAKVFSGCGQTVSEGGKKTYSLITFQTIVALMLSAYARKTANRLSKDQRIQLGAYLDVNLCQEFGLSTNAAVKYTASADDFKRVLQAVHSPAMAWSNGRERIQFHFLWLAIAYCTLRPVEALVMDSYKQAGDKDCVKYGDIAVFLVLDKNSKIRVKVDITHRLLKGKRHDGGKFKTTVLYEADCDLPVLDPTTPLLALCFLDNVFQDIESIDALCAVSSDTIQEFGGFLPLRIKSEWLNIPIMRHSPRDGAGESGWATSLSEGYAYFTAANRLERLGRMCGFTASLTFYAIRRSSIDVMNSIKSASEGALKNASGHNPGSSMWNQRYLSSRSTVDRQAVFAGTDGSEVPSIPLEMVQGIPRINEAPTTLSIESQNLLKNDQEILEAHAARSAWRAAATADPENEEVALRGRRAKEDYFNLMERKKKQMFAVQLGNFVEARLEAAFESPDAGDENGSPVRALKRALDAFDESDSFGKDLDSADAPHGESDSDGLADLATFPDTPISIAARSLQPLTFGNETCKRLTKILFEGESTDTESRESLKLMVSNEADPLNSCWRYPGKVPAENNKCPVPCIREDLGRRYANLYASVTGLRCPATAGPGGKHVADHTDLAAFLKHVRNSHCVNATVCRFPAQQADSDAICGEKFKSDSEAKRHYNLVHGFIEKQITAAAAGKPISMGQSHVTYCNSCREWQVGIRAIEEHATWHVPQLLDAMKVNRLCFATDMLIAGAAIKDQKYAA
ncbi:hypothetical protein HDU86_001941 [Geranomyces michiganensis]|nr:hypothetical protein HDU86_001941 [Geranomyces michiganensis]